MRRVFHVWQSTEDLDQGELKLSHLLPFAVGERLLLHALGEGGRDPTLVEVTRKTQKGTYVRRCEEQAAPPKDAPDNPEEVPMTHAADERTCAVTARYESPDAMNENVGMMLGGHSAWVAVEDTPEDLAAGTHVLLRLCLSKVQSARVAVRVVIEKVEAGSAMLAVRVLDKASMRALMRYAAFSR